MGCPLGLQHYFLSADADNLHVAPPQHKDHWPLDAKEVPIDTDGSVLVGAVSWGALHRLERYRAAEDVDAKAL